ncbi:shikimate O-hydroxycinnamoyltransferase-like protein [Tanacetum coccineum]|uniref:Shikimate O-hydroxycinnamoyltransferase-like protein n=1 Tax=Tanacetum coccineum TaxID=301880 RepID=A0ABQ4WHX7_9ASTR
MKITLKQSSMIKPSKTTPYKQIWNSNLDLVVGRIHILTLYFFRPNGSENFFDSETLKKSLADVLVLFYPMAGRLGYDDGEGERLVIECNGEGVMFNECESDCEIDDFGVITPSPELRKLAPTVEYSGDVSSYPLVVLQVTRFKCGGVSLGCGIHHTLSDGLSSLHFINSWSDVTRGLSVAIPPFVERTVLRVRDPPTVVFDHVEYPNSFHDHGLTSEQIIAIKAKGKGDGTVYHSQYEILAAHLWRCACKARGLMDDQLTKLYVATDGRSRLIPPLPPGYLGNVVFTATPIAKSGELEYEPLGWHLLEEFTGVSQMNVEY